jgi:hypothetical protein
MAEESSSVACFDRGLHTATAPAPWFDCVVTAGYGRGEASEDDETGVVSAAVCCWCRRTLSSTASFWSYASLGCPPIRFVGRAPGSAGVDAMKTGF